MQRKNNKPPKIDLTIPNKKGYEWNKLKKIAGHWELTVEVKKRLTNERDKLAKKLSIVDELLARPTKKTKSERRNGNI